MGAGPMKEGKIMTEVFGEEVTTSSPDETKKQRKKQAKREAKTMLKLEQAKENVQKRELKLARAELRLEAAIAEAQAIEAKLAAMQISQEEVEIEQAPEGDMLEVGLNGQQGLEGDVASVIEQEVVLSEIEHWTENAQEQESLSSESSSEATEPGAGAEITTDTLESAPHSE